MLQVDDRASIRMHTGLWSVKFIFHYVDLDTATLILICCHSVHPRNSTPTGSAQCLIDSNGGGFMIQPDVSSF